MRGSGFAWSRPDRRLIMGVAGGVLFVPLFILSGVEPTWVTWAASRPADPALLVGFFGMILVFAAISLLIQWLYHAYLESGEKQATWGKQALDCMSPT